MKKKLDNELETVNGGGLFVQRQNQLSNDYTKQDVVVGGADQENGIEEVTPIIIGNPQEEEEQVITIGKKKPRIFQGSAKRKNIPGRR